MSEDQLSFCLRGSCPRTLANDRKPLTLSWTKDGNVASAIKMSASLASSAIAGSGPRITGEREHEVCDLEA